MRARVGGATIAGMNSLAELARLIENLVRFGTIAEVQHCRLACGCALASC